jgi:hypothetical protein
MTPRIGSGDSATRLTLCESRGFASPPHDGYAFCETALCYQLFLRLIGKKLEGSPRDWRCLESYGTSLSSDPRSSVRSLRPHPRSADNQELSSRQLPLDGTHMINWIHPQGPIHIAAPSRALLPTNPRASGLFDGDLLRPQRGGPLCSARQQLWSALSRRC